MPAKTRRRVHGAIPENCAARPTRSARAASSRQRGLRPLARRPRHAFALEFADGRCTAHDSWRRPATPTSRKDTVADYLRHATAGVPLAHALDLKLKNPANTKQILCRLRPRPRPGARGCGRPARAQRATLGRGKRHALDGHAHTPGLVPGRLRRLPPPFTGDAVSAHYAACSKTRGPWRGRGDGPAVGDDFREAHARRHGGARRSTASSRACRSRRMI